MHLVLCILYGFGLVRDFAFLNIFTFEFGSVLGKTWVLVWFVLAGFVFFPISTLHVGISEPCDGECLSFIIVTAKDDNMTSS